MMLHKWESMIFEALLITFVEIESELVTLLGSRDCIIKLISFAVALGKSFESLKFCFIWVIIR